MTILSKHDKSRNSTDAFIARVKEQLSTSEPPAGNEKDFTSTIPQLSAAHRDRHHPHSTVPCPRQAVAGQS
jgi:hypothetical protein